MQPIGIVVSPYESKFGVPKQATISDRNDTLFADGKIVLFPGFELCISNLEGFDYIWVLSLMHLNRGLPFLKSYSSGHILIDLATLPGFRHKIRPQPVANAQQRPPHEVGLFSSRAPHRPNPIALSALKVLHVDRGEWIFATDVTMRSPLAAKGEIHVRGIDLLNDTPVLDIKPYVPAFDSFPEARAGWMDLINPNASESRRLGYQTIRSPRGERAARFQRKNYGGKVDHDHDAASDSD